MTATSIRLQAELKEPPEMLSKRLNRNRSYSINQSLKEFIVQQKLAEKRWQETLPALESVATGRTIPADKVFEWVRSWGTDNELPRPIMNMDKCNL